MNKGDPFNPYKLFVGIFIPNALARYTEISQGAKLCYGRLSQYAGENGKAWPAHETLAAELGIKPRMVRNYIDELKQNNFLKVVHTQASNHYIFLWHEVLEESIRGGDNSTRQDTTTPPGKILPPEQAIDCQGRESVKESVKEKKQAAAEPSFNNKALNTVIAHYKDQVEIYSDFKPQIKPAEAKALKELLQKFTTDEINLMLNEMFKCDDPYFKREGWPLLVFCSQVNKFAARVAKGSKTTTAEKINQKYSLAAKLAEQILSNGWDSVDIENLDHQTDAEMRQLVFDNMSNEQRQATEAARQEYTNSLKGKELIAT